jgi:endonuclease YncB( thermonuclease family)
LVRNGFALNVEASATGRFQVDEAHAKDDRQGLWKGCFVAPREFRAGKKDGPLLGAACRPTATAKSARPCSPRIS